MYILISAQEICLCTDVILAPTYIVCSLGLVLSLVQSVLSAAGGKWLRVCIAVHTAYTYVLFSSTEHTMYVCMYVCMYDLYVCI